MVELPGIFSNVPIYLINRQIWDCENITFGKDFNADVVSGLIGEKEVKIFYQNDVLLPKTYILPILFPFLKMLRNALSSLK